MVHFALWRLTFFLYLLPVVCIVCTRLNITRAREVPLSSKVRHGQEALACWTHNLTFIYSFFFCARKHTSFYKWPGFWASFSFLACWLIFLWSLCFHVVLKGTNFGKFHTFGVGVSLDSLVNKLPMTNKPCCAIFHGEYFTVVWSDEDSSRCVFFLWNDNRQRLLHFQYQDSPKGQVVSALNFTFVCLYVVETFTCLNRWSITTYTSVLYYVPGCHIFTQYFNSVSKLHYRVSVLVLKT